MRRALATALCLALLAGASPGSAEQGSPAGKPASERQPDPSEKFPPAWEAALKTTGDDALYLLTSPLRLTGETALVVGLIGAGIGVISTRDREIRGEVAHRKKDSLDDAASAISLFGYAPVLLGLNLGGVALGEGIREYSGDRKLLDTTLLALETQLITLAFSEGIAYATARSGPEDSSDPFSFKLGRSSFPSSHTSQAFAVAAVFSDRYGQPVSALAYGLAGLVGISRVVQNKHWASDVAAGAAIGWAIGKALSLRHSKSRSYLDFFPFADPQQKSYGFVIEKRF